jgi:hypothetical protein
MTDNKDAAHCTCGPTCNCLVCACEVETPSRRQTCGAQTACGSGAQCDCRPACECTPDVTCRAN